MTLVGMIVGFEFSRLGEYIRKIYNVGNHARYFDHYS
jgi:hypothetical protein